MARKPAFQGPARRGHMLAERARALPLRERYPKLGKLEVQLRFAGGGSLMHSPQLHTMHPGATAFFRFACPCMGCDGDFDLTAQVQQLAAPGTARPRPLAGRLECTGQRVHFPGGAGPCRLVADFHIAGSPPEGAGSPR